MKTKIAIALTALTIGSLFATPLFVLIMQESEKTADAIRAFNKQCPGDSEMSEKKEDACRKKRHAIIVALAELIDLAKGELDFLSSADKNKVEHEFWVQTQKRLTDTQLQIKWAHHYIDCLGRENVPQCEQEKAELDKAEYPFGRIGLASPDKPTHEGDEEAKHWHAYPIKILPSPTPSR